MDSQTSRWMQMQRFSEDQCLEIQKHENSAFLGKVKTMDKRDWIQASWPLLDKFNRELGPFWDKKKTHDEQSAEVRDYERAIYLIWAPFKTKWCEENKLEITILHDLDRIIYDKAPRINRWPTGSKGKDLETMLQDEA